MENRPQWGVPYSPHLTLHGEQTKYSSSNSYNSTTVNRSITVQFSGYNIKLTGLFVSASFFFFFFIGRGPHIYHRYRTPGHKFLFDTPFLDFVSVQGWSWQTAHAQVGGVVWWTSTLVHEILPYGDNLYCCQCMKLLTLFQQETFLYNVK